MLKSSDGDVTAYSMKCDLSIISIQRRNMTMSTSPTSNDSNVSAAPTSSTRLWIWRRELRESIGCTQCRSLSIESACWILMLKNYRLVPSSLETLNRRVLHQTTAAMAFGLWPRQPRSGVCGRRSKIDTSISNRCHFREGERDKDKTWALFLGTGRVRFVLEPEACILREVECCSESQ
jgi:hypothetical protein